jgi:CMP-N-acetylneuraminic acid synthetase
MFLVNVEKCLKIFDKVFVSSDSDYVLDQAEMAGAIPIKRGEELCGDTPNIPVYQHALQFMGETSGIVAVQANSPTIDINIIGLAKKLMEWGLNEVMTCHEDRFIYGSVWALSRKRLLNYPDPYRPKPDILIKDISVDIHDEKDYKQALNQ